MPRLSPFLAFYPRPAVSHTLPPHFLAPALALRWSSTSPRTQPPPRARGPTPDEDGHIARAPHAPWHPPEYVDRKRTFVPEPLDRPLGLPNPPQPGDNDGADRRTWRQRRAEFQDKERHLAERRRL